MSTEPASQTSAQPPTFTIDTSVVSFQVPARIYLSTLPKDSFIFKPSLTPRYIAVGALTFDSSNRILLIQRASTDSMPHLWEIPGGGCDDDDPTILHSVARELEEESGLVAQRIGPLVGDGHVFVTSSGKVVCKYNFLVEIVDEPGDGGTVVVRLDSNEHQDHVWATEDEVQTERGGDLDLRFTKAEQKQVVLDAFRIRRARMGNSEDKTENATTTVCKAANSEIA